MQAIRIQLETVQRSVGNSSVEQALLLVRQLAARPRHVFDAFALIGALQNLEEVARLGGHADAKKFGAVLAQCKRLPPEPILGEIVTRLLGDEVQREVANAVSKILKQRPFPPPQFNMDRRYNGPGNQRQMPY